MFNTKRIFNFRKRLAENIWEIGFKIMPKCKDANYLIDTFEGMNMKHQKIKCAEGKGVPTTKTILKWVWKQKGVNYE